MVMFMLLSIYPLIYSIRIFGLIFSISSPLLVFLICVHRDLFSVPNTHFMDTTSVETVQRTHKAVITESYLISYPEDTERVEEDKLEADWISDYLPEGEEPMEPISDIYYPIIANANKHIEVEDGAGEEGHDLVALFAISVYWRDTIRNILPEGTHGLLAVFENPCNPTFTYEINGPDVVFLGAGDFHDHKFDNMAVGRVMTELGKEAMEESSYSGIPIDEEFCPFHVSVYPTDQTQDNHTTLTPIYFSLVTVIIFTITAVTFLVYDFWVERRQKVVMKTAVTTTALVSSLFPDVVMDRMIPADNMSATNSQPKRLKSFLNDEMNDDVVSGAGNKRMSKPIAELFPDTTVFFGDIAGFTAWSSVREPAHVFTLLETLYGAFDKIAKHYGIFKIETIGDSYVAVCGLPEPRKKHAVAMGRFAFECVNKMNETTQELELVLGPGTADLRLRIGLHSGPTIAGVLRGEKARFQLFGDTVNTAARMESTGFANKIQVSQKTADLIIASGRESWLTKREDLVNAKGKGLLQTYWLSLKRSASRTSSVLGSVTDGSDLIDLSPSLGTNTPIDPKIQRLIDWNVAIFQELLDEIVAHRRATQMVPSSEEVVESTTNKSKHVRDEVVETISMPDYNGIVTQNGETSKLDSKVIIQLRDYITQIASFYHSDNSFHNFQHASHVIMSTIKLLQRIATPDVKKKDCVTEKEYFNFTFGISSDPLTKFAVVFSALIHDVDHQGVSNFQLAKEKDPMAVEYDNKSVLEQHSLDLAWSLLSESRFKELRECIYSTQEEHDRFRQLSVNCVLATDIFDKEMKSFRDSRWEKAFKPSHEDSITRSQNNDDWNRKATITIECIIQASDVAHTMQHWHVYVKWNKGLFDEMYTAYKNGRSDKDPALGWYEGELWFFDNYIIPLATKLQECEVFGVSCDECLDFANENRNEWSVKGREIVAQMLDEAKSQAKRMGGNAITE
jgi:class 3 adenylate cyclase